MNVEEPLNDTGRAPAVSGTSLELIRRAYRHVTGRDAGRLSGDAEVTDLGLDSIQVMTMVSWLEVELAIRIPDVELMIVTTVGDLASIIERHGAVAT
jgi:acyl carrier protein